jgi:murein DD-endopeptidase MepM/ murein hydrolase activator NlpD
VIVRHNDREYSHLFHLRKGSITVAVGEHVQRGQHLGEIGFSGAATTYAHLHYHLLDGPDFLRDRALPCTFSGVTVIENGERVFYDETVLDTGDFVRSA